jgi:hypothetical protein
VGERLISGEEQFVTSRLAAHGHGAWYAGAVTVRHSIQASRLNRAWLFSRLYWQGVSEAILTARLGQRGRMWAKAARMAAKLVLGVPSLIGAAESEARISRRGGTLFAAGYLRGALAAWR